MILGIQNSITGPRPSYAAGFARNAAESEHPNLWTGLVGLWAPSLGPTGLTLFDHAGKRDDGTLTNMDPATAWQVDTRQHLLFETASSQYVDTGVEKIGGTGLFCDSSERFAVSVWFRVPLNETGTIMARASGTESDRTFQIYFLNTVQHSPTIVLRGSVNQTGLDLDDDLWHLIDVTWNGTAARLYVDGQDKGALTVGAAVEDTGQRIIIGARTNGTGFFLDGRVGQVAIWDRATTLNEHQERFDNPNALLQPRLRIFAAVAVDLRYWRGTTSTDHADIDNWSDTDGGATPASSVPGVGDHAHFTGNGNNPCTLTAHWALLHLTTVAGYNVKLDLATYNLTMDDGGNVILDQGGEFDCGTGSHSLTNGNFDNKDVGTFTRDTSEWTFNGTCNITGKSNKWFHKITFPVGSAITISGATDGRPVAINTFTINGSVVLNADLGVAYTGHFVLNEGASFSGNAELALYDNGSGAGLTTLHPSVTVPKLRMGYSVAGTRLAAGTYGGSVRIFSGFGSSTTVTLDNGTYNFNGGLELENRDNDNTTLDNSINGPTINIAGDLRIDLKGAVNIVINNSGKTVNWDIQGDIINQRTGGGTFTWMKGLGTITASGSNDQDWDLMEQTIEDIVIDKSAGTLTLSGSFTTDTFTGTDGTFDPNEKTITIIGNCNWAAAFVFDSAVDCMNGCTWDIGGNFTADGQTLKATATWYLQVDGTAVASGTGAVAHSDASGYTKIEASAGPWIDNGNNANWNFAVGNPWYYYAQQQAVGA